ncbi:Ribosomal RNA small subunit methyltransferase A [Labeo rohita]|uniref:Ribosomal RNA small subunit methyltransferase A n=1 Tax=Labeo rohita TaxID=84645 RepID=A0ABQ8ML45_LABRO|nr:Ribosomal RNA small subunit methyltransferase A [Labeo rohita]
MSYKDHWTRLPVVGTTFLTRLSFVKLFCSVPVLISLRLLSLPMKYGADFRFRLKGCCPRRLFDQYMGQFYSVDSGICSLSIYGSLTLSGGTKRHVNGDGVRRRCRRDGDANRLKS